MNTTSRRILSVVTIGLLAIVMVFAAAVPSFAAKKKVYKVPYQISGKNSGGSYTQTFVIKKGKLTSVKYGGEYPSTTKLTYKSSSKIIMSYTDIETEHILTLKKNKVVKKTGNNGFCKYSYDKKNRLKKAVIDNSTSEHGVNILTMTFTRSKKGDVTKKVEHLVDKPVDETFEPTDITTTYKYTNKYKKGLLTSQKITAKFGESTFTNSRSFKYKKLKLTKAQYTTYMSLWDMFNEA